jgi:membrane protease YdiL (CAAX protease family)
MQSLHFIWGLIATEALLILLPTVAFLRLRRIPLQEGLRLKPIRPLIGLLCVLLGFCTFLYTVIIEAVMAQLTGMPSVPIPAESLPKGTLEFIGYFVALAVAAPLCEEPLFRGVIQGAYEKQRAARFAIIITALMFAFYHLRLSGLPGLLPVAFILGYVTWRSRSVYASMLVHFGMNAPAAVHTLLALSNGKGLPFLGLPAAVVGLVATGLLLYAIWCLQPVEEQPAPPEQGKRWSWLWNYWPLAGAGLVYLGVAGLTMATTFTTGQITLKQAGYDKVRINQVLESRFRITNRAGGEVGEMTCTITPQDANIRLDCASKVKAYEVKTSTGYFKDGNHTAAWSATWDTNTMDLLEFTFERTYEEAESNFRAAVRDGRLVVENSTGTQELAVTPDDLVEYEWAWRTNALRPQFITSIQAPFVRMSLWDAGAGRSYPTLKNEVLHLYRSQPLNLPAGRFSVWKASVGGQAAWYAKEHAGPVRLDDGMLIYELEK